MAIRDLLWACPFCATTGGLRANQPRRRRSSDRCHACGAEFRRDLGATILASTESGDRIRLSPRQWLERLPPIEQATLPSELGPERVSVRVAGRKQPIRQRGELIGWLDRFGPSRHGTLQLTRDRLLFDAPDGPLEWRLDRITTVQPTSAKLQLAASRMPVAAIRFSSGSLRFWEEAIREGVRRTWRATGRGEITEFHPHISTR